MCWRAGQDPDTTPVRQYFAVASYRAENHDETHTHTPTR